LLRRFFTERNDQESGAEYGGSGYSKIAAIADAGTASSTNWQVIIFNSIRARFQPSFTGRCCVTGPAIHFDEYT
jgi:hypothetical protein